MNMPARAWYHSCHSKRREGHIDDIGRIQTVALVSHCALSDRARRSHRHADSRRTTTLAPADTGPDRPAPGSDCMLARPRDPLYLLILPARLPGFTSYRLHQPARSGSKTAQLSEMRSGRLVSGDGLTDRYAATGYVSSRTNYVEKARVPPYFTGR